MDNLTQSIGELARGAQKLARKAEGQYSVEVEAIMKARSHDSRRIEKCLDGMLDFCFDDGMLMLYKKLCRYYFAIDPEATASYVQAYREMWKEGRKKVNLNNMSPPKTLAAEIRRTQEVLEERMTLSLTPLDKTRGEKHIGQKGDTQNIGRKLK